MTAEEREELWRFIELSRQTMIAYQTDIAWERHDIAMGRSPVEAAAGTIHASNAIAEHHRNALRTIAQSRRRQ